METFRNIIEYFALLMGAVMLVSLTNKQLQIFQQSSTVSGFPEKS